MAYSSEIKARLGLDTQSFKQSLDDAKSSFKKFGSDIQSSSGKASADAGSKLAESFVKKFSGGEAIGSALGINLAKISEGIAAAIVGGTKEGFEEAIKTEERISKALDARDARRLSSAKQIQSIEGEIASKKRESDSIVGARQGRAGRISELTPEQDAKKRTIAADVLELQNKLDNARDAAAKRTEKIAEDEEASKDKNLRDEERLTALFEERVKIQKQLLVAKQTEAQMDDLKAKLTAKTNEISEQQKKIYDKELAREKEISKVQESSAKQIHDFNESQMSEEDRLKALLDDVLEINKKIALSKEDQAGYADLLAQKTEKELKLAKEAASVRKGQIKDSGKTNGDENKLSLEELANLNSFQTGVSTTVGSESDQAREALKIKKQAEEARKLGNSDQAEELRGKYDTIRGGLTSLKSADRGSGAELATALQPTNSLLQSIDKTLGNKFVNQ